MLGEIGQAVTIPSYKDRRELAIGRSVRYSPQDLRVVGIKATAMVEVRRGDECGSIFQTVLRMP